MTTDPFQPVREALDSLAGATPTLFIRDDDAGWDDTRLLHLLDTTAHAAVPIDLAAIPLATGAALAGELCARIDAAPGLVGVHQHGLAHLNHETEGRRCEFGPARHADTRRADLLHGRALLRERFGARLDPIFTPPWNRCTADTAALLSELGWQALSRDRGAAPQQAIDEIAVDVDWCRHHREGGLAAVGSAFAEALRARHRDGHPLGLMLHHAAMSAEECRGVADLVRVTRAHALVRWVAMAEVLASRAARTPAAHRTGATVERAA